jgi:hypothetical protein
MGGQHRRQHQRRIELRADDAGVEGYAGQDDSRAAARVGGDCEVDEVESAKACEPAII